MDIGGNLSDLATILRSLGALRDAGVELIQPKARGESEGVESRDDVVVQIGEQRITIPPERHIDPVAAERILWATVLEAARLQERAVEEISDALRQINERIDRLERNRE